ncbi:WhiB family transcriptional regulator [Trebonia sp.]|uniref:WhiB family transcriptional regulator n=1 Tax=Trebonia sp. TaxID=2767075 RepID=UPI00345B52A0
MCRLARDHCSRRPCPRSPVRPQCLRFALRNQAGLRQSGGLTEDERHHAAKTSQGT